jgi:hypothetical protein
MHGQTPNNLLKITRGDTADFKFRLNIGSTINPKEYTLQPGDRVYFGVTEPRKPFEHSLIMKVLDGDSSLVTINFTPEDTEYVIPGTYYYSLKIRTANEDVYTVIDKRKFIILD